MVGTMLTLVAWGVVIDRRGERLVLLAGLVGTAAVLGSLAALSGSWCCSASLGLAGLAAASTNAASGRVVVGWFPPGGGDWRWGSGRWPSRWGSASRRPMAVVADRTGRTPRVGAGVACAPRRGPRRAGRDRPAAAGAGPTAAPNPYRADRFLPRIHGVSVLLVVPAVRGVDLRAGLAGPDRGWSPAAAGAWSRAPRWRGRWAGSGPASSRTWWGAGCVRCAGWRSPRPRDGCPGRRRAGPGGRRAAVCVATVVTVADNGLAFTAVANGPDRSGPAARSVRRTPPSSSPAPRAPRWRGGPAQLGYPPSSPSRPSSRWPRTAGARRVSSASSPDGARRRPRPTRWPSATRPKPTPKIAQRHEAVGEREACPAPKAAVVLVAVLTAAEHEVDALEDERPEVGHGVRRVGGQPAPDEEAEREGQQDGDDRDHGPRLSPSMAEGRRSPENISDHDHHGEHDAETPTSALKRHRHVDEERGEAGQGDDDDGAGGDPQRRRGCRARP